MKDDALFPDGPLADLDNDFAAEPGASSMGIVQCLRMLADEASSLQMHRTLAALREAMEICTTEGASALRDESAALTLTSATFRPRTRLH
jgi:hypothetical protein